MRQLSQENVILNSEDVYKSINFRKNTNTQFPNLLLRRNMHSIPHIILTSQQAKQKTAVLLKSSCLSQICCPTGYNFIL